ncbi:APC family permease [Kineococcus indalonis]|uniref:APC family permease n=1 Tax=Kineococcus indalonis TaxID=2696566 RepID=UPI0014131070|nr:APC family permease [Kineococcus indalonis]NAZ84663.1 amino acid permease [Kineococcus indalonis]
MTTERRRAGAPERDDRPGPGGRRGLRRDVGAVGAFAAGFSFVSILTTVFQLFSFGYSFGGPAFFWTWPLVIAGQLCVALVFAELAGHTPVAGCIFQWSRRLAGTTAGWFAGWWMLLGYVVSVAAIAVAAQSVLPEVWSGFQVVGGDPALDTRTGATNAIVLGVVLIALATVVGSLGVKVMSAVNVVGITCEVVGVVLLVALLLAHAERGPEVLLDTGGTEGSGSYVWPFLASSLMAAYVMYGFDSAAELSEETKNPRRTTPRAILQAVTASAVGGALLLVAALVAAPSLTDGRLASAGISHVVTSRLGSTLGTALLVVVAIAIVAALLAIQTSASRVAFSMARDGALPFSERLAHVHPRTGTPVRAAVVVGVAAVLVLLVNLGRAGVFTAVTSVSVVVVYLAYLLVTVPALVRRSRDRRHPLAGAGPQPRVGFSLGRWGWPVNVVAVVFGALMVVNMAWPRAEVYAPEGGPWFLRFFPELFLLVTALAGAAVFRARRHRFAEELEHQHAREVAAR